MHIEVIKKLLEEPEKILSEKEVLLSLCGEDEDGESRAFVCIKMSDVDIEEETEVVLDELVLETPIINVYRTINNTTIDLTFLNDQDYDFVNTVGRLNEFMKYSIEEQKTGIIRTISLTLNSKDVSLMDYYSTGIHATWVLQPSRIGGDIDTIRFIFKNEYFSTFKSNQIGNPHV